MADGKCPMSWVMLRLVGPLCDEVVSINERPNKAYTFKMSLPQIGAKTFCATNTKWWQKKTTILIHCPKRETYHCHPSKVFGGVRWT